MAGIHVRAFAIKRHAAEPLRDERERFLQYRQAQGFDALSLRVMAARILQVVRLLQMDAIRPVTSAEIEAAAERWAGDTEHRLRDAPGRSSKRLFKEAARLFLGFHGCLLEPKEPFAMELRVYLNSVRERGVAVATARGHEKDLRLFLRWTAARRNSLGDVTGSDLQEYLALKSKTRAAPALFNTGRRLRAFVAFAEGRGWIRPNLHRVIKVPARRARASAEDLPTWAEVRRLLDSDFPTTPSGYRSRAMLVLCSVYGFRSSEVTRLALSDIDWVESTIMVTRAKSGRTQEFPLVSEAAEAVRLYLTNGRPKCDCRALFVSLTHPYRPAKPTTINNVTSELMAKLGIKSVRRGPHALRHAAATELLRTGSSLRQIADFLGHKNLKTVSVYAKADAEALREVGNFSLRSVL